jgi:hypothetical protein
LTQKLVQKILPSIKVLKMENILPEKYLISGLKPLLKKIQNLDKNNEDDDNNNQEQDTSADSSDVSSSEFIGKND